MDNETLSTPAQSAELRQGAAPRAEDKNKYRMLAIHLLSNHLGAEGYNEQNPGLGVRLGSGDWYAAAGGYKNSLGRDSVYAGGGKTLGRMGPVDLNLNGGLVTGYDLPVAPYLSPELALKIGKARVMLNYIPRVKIGDKKSDQALGLSLGAEF